MTKRVRIVRILLLAAAMLAAAFAWHRVSGWYGRMMQQRAQNEIAWSAPPMEAGAVFYLALDRPTGHNGALPVFGLCSLPTSAGIVSSGTEDTISLEADGTPEAAAAEGSPRYVLFVPGSARATGLRVQFEGELLLDGQPLASGQRLELAEGEHRLTAPQGEWLFTVLYGSEIPCMFIETATGSLETIHASKRNTDSAAFTLLGPDGALDQGGWIDRMCGHGNSTWDYSEKKPYQITLAERLPLAGMPAARRWVLLANRYDATLLRNQIVYRLAQSIGMPYTPETRQVELYVNGEYRGCYLLAEKVEVDENRVNIPDLDEMNRTAMDRAGEVWTEEFARVEEGVSREAGYYFYARLPAEADAGAGGYLLELDRIYRAMETDNACYITRGWKAVNLKSPSSATERQIKYIAALFQRLEDICYPPDNASQPERLGQVVDLQSFARKYLIEEFTQNGDANITSQHFYKYPDSISPKLFAGPVWDYDSAFRSSPEGFLVNGEIDEPETPLYFFWAEIYRQPDFQQAMREAFSKEFVPAVENMLEEGWVGRQGEELAASACMDALRWDGRAPQVFAQEYRQEVEAVDAYLAARLDFLKGEWMGV